MNITRRRLLGCAVALALGNNLPVFAGTGKAIETKVNDHIKNKRRLGLVSSNERTAWMVYDLRSARQLVAINENVPLQAASMVKPLVIQAYLMCHHYKSKSKYPLNSKTISDMRTMIVHSNNEATNNIIRRLGGPSGVQWMLKKNAPQIFRNINIVEYIPARGQTYRNRASAGDYDRFLRALWNNSLPGAEFLKDMMKIPNNDRIKKGTQYVDKNAVVYDKTGSTAMLCGNTGIISCRTRNGVIVPYTITAIIEKSRRSNNYGTWISARSNVIRSVSDLVYQYIANQYHL